MAYLQVSLLGCSHNETWQGEGIRRRFVSWNLPKLSQLWGCNGGFRPSTTQNHLQTKQFLSGIRNSRRCAEPTVTGINYLHILQLWLMPQLQEGSKDFIFQQDGAPPCFHFNSAKKKNGLGWWPQLACSFRSAQAAILLEYLLPLKNCFVCRWFCVVLGPKPLLHHYNWLSLGKFKDTERFLITCPRHISSQLLPSGKICKYTMASITQTNLERFSTYWYATFCCITFGCCAAKFGNSGGTYKLPCISFTADEK
jgi:hypothetical protein